VSSRTCAEDFVEAQLDTRLFIHRIDSENCIIFVNDAWLSFARENNAPQLTSESVLNRPLSSFITDIETRHLYEVVVAKVRTTGAIVKIPFRCDSPDRRRFMELGIFSRSREVLEFRSHMLRQESRDPIDLFTSAAERSEELLTMCSICKKAKMFGERWYEVEEAIDVFDLFGPPKPPLITHGICPACAEIVE
jgi:hypothetical protein